MEIYNLNFNGVVISKNLNCFQMQDCLKERDLFSYSNFQNINVRNSIKS